MNKNFNKMKESRRENLLLSAPKKQRKHHHPRNPHPGHCPKVYPKHWVWKTLLKKNLMRMMSWPSSRQRLGRCARIRVGLDWRNPPRRCSRRRKTKKRASLYLECKNLGHFKSECLELEKSKDKYKHFKSKDKKSLMSTWEDLNDTTSDEEGEE